MGDAGEDLHGAELNLQPLEDDCKLLSSLLDDTLKLEVGPGGFQKLNKIRCAPSTHAQRSHAATSALPCSTRVCHRRPLVLRGHLFALLAKGAAKVPAHLFVPGSSAL